METRHKGNIAEAYVIAKLLKLGKTVLIPYGNMERYDIVINKEDGSFVKGQVKTGRYKNGSIIFNVASSNYKGIRRSYIGQIDVFWVYCSYTEKVYEIPIEIVPKHDMSLRVEPNKNKKPYKHLAIDFEI